MIQLNESQTAEIARLKSYFPYRVIYAWFDKTTGVFTASASRNMRVPNLLAEAGHTVVICK